MLPQEKVEERCRKTQSLLHLGVLDTGAGMPCRAPWGSTRVVRRQEQGEGGEHLVKVFSGASAEKVGQGEQLRTG